MAAQDDLAAERATEVPSDRCESALERAWAEPRPNGGEELTAWQARRDAAYRGASQAEKAAHRARANAGEREHPEHAAHAAPSPARAERAAVNAARYCDRLPVEGVRCKRAPGGGWLPAHDERLSSTQRVAVHAYSFARALGSSRSRARAMCSPTVRRGRGGGRPRARRAVSRSSGGGSSGDASGDDGPGEPARGKQHLGIRAPLAASIALVIGGRS
jgi:hypothetical protein